MPQAEFENLLKDAMGLHAPSIGWPTIERAVRLRMSRLGFTRADDYEQHLSCSTDELQELIEGVVVPETWFFRDPEAFATLVRLVAETLRSKPSTRTVRLLSVPCSTGEEPYSIAMSLLDGGLSPQQFQLDAVDISSRALASATRGVYGTNSFRSANLAFRERYFLPVADKYAVVESLRRVVTFRQGNILSPEVSSRQELYDVIFCRNLLIYFERSTQARVMKMLGALLKTDGVLFVGPAESFLASCSGFTAVNHAMSFAFRKTGTTLARSDFSLPEPRKPLKKHAMPHWGQMTTTLVPRRSDDRNGCDRGPEFTTPAPVTSLPHAGDLETAHRLADAGQLEKAAAWCEANLVEHGPSSGTYYLLGLVRDAIGDRASAAEFYRKVIYLEPDHVDGLVHLALLTEKRGDVAAAERLRERARRVERRTREKAL